MLYEGDTVQVCVFDRYLPKFGTVTKVLSREARVQTEAGETVRVNLLTRCTVGGSGEWWRTVSADQVEAARASALEAECMEQKMAALSEARQQDQRAIKKAMRQEQLAVACALLAGPYGARVLVDEAFSLYKLEFTSQRGALARWPGERVVWLFNSRAKGDLCEVTVIEINVHAQYGMRCNSSMRRGETEFEVLADLAAVQHV